MCICIHVCVSMYICIYSVLALKNIAQRTVIETSSIHIVIVIVFSLR